MSNNQRAEPRELMGREWRERAACRVDSGVDPELFFPTAESGPEYRAQVARAKTVCAGCLVRAACLAEALVRLPYGIAGGLTEHERRTLRRDDGRRTSGRTAAVRAEVEAALEDGLRPGLTARAAERERARVGRALLASGRSTGQVARACGVTARTVQRWAVPFGSTTGTSEGSRGGNRAPLGISTARHALAGITAPEGDRG